MHLAYYHPFTTHSSMESDQLGVTKAEEIQWHLARPQLNSVFKEQQQGTAGDHDINGKSVCILD